jgi:hypothetical protein
VAPASPFATLTGVPQRPTPCLAELAVPGDLPLELLAAGRLLVGPAAWLKHNERADQPLVASVAVDVEEALLACVVVGV